MRWRYLGLCLIPHRRLVLRLRARAALRDAGTRTVLRLRVAMVLPPFTSSVATTLAPPSYASHVLGKYGTFGR